MDQVKEATDCKSAEPETWPIRERDEDDLRLPRELRGVRAADKLLEADCPGT